MRVVLSFITLLVATAVAVSGCSASKTAKGAVIGGAAGAGVGAAAGGKKGAVIGGAAGVVVGGLIGKYMEDQEKKLKEVEGATVVREGDMLKVTFDSAILFDSDKAELKGSATDNLTKVANVLNEYPETNLMIEGHTDSQNTEPYNQRLSERRADAVKVYLIEKGVGPSRLKTKGYGEMTPVATNETPEGRAQNRRVEVKIEANEDLKAKAAAEENKG
jgi:outer membrane protein OmpA-like peptidoglycan-associated protein